MKAMRELLRILATLGVVIGAATTMLAGLDLVPQWLAGAPAGVIRCADLEEAQRRGGARLLVPAYFPDSLAWPPARITLVAGPPASAALSFTGRPGGAEHVLLAQSLVPGGTIAPELWPPAVRVSARRIEVAGAETELVRVLTADGAFWHELAFVAQGRRIALRSQGSVEDLLRMARSLERDVP